MIIGIYARKSVYRDNSDSVSVQVKSCKDYAKLIFSDKELNFKVYDSDEGFSGKNTDRPSYRALMSDVKSNKLDAVMVYKLDRISRSVKDFSNTYETMQSHNVAFLSVKESFDTSTPIGRTVMYILAAFAQLERENTSERVTDSMYALGASGKWTGGKVPTGMSSIRKVVGDKEHSYLIVDNERIKLVKMLGEMLVSGYSITKLERYCRENGIKSESGKFLNTSQIHFILSNPVYCSNDLDAYYYFEEKGYKLPDKPSFDGKHGLIAYGRTDQSNGNKKRSSYTLSIGIHDPVFSGSDWIKIQERFGQNKMLRSSKYEIGILKGILTCNCGSRMDVKTYCKKGSVFSYYYCARMHRQGKEYCNSGYIRTDIIDDLFIRKLKEIQIDPSSVSVKKSIDAVPVSIEKLHDDLKAAENALENLTSALMDNKDSSAATYIIARMEKLDREKKVIESSIRRAEIGEMNRISEAETRDQIHHNVCILLDNFETLSYREKNELIKRTVRSCVFDGNSLTVTF